MNDDDHEMTPPLLEASAEGDAARVVTLLRAGVPIDFVSKGHETALTYAIVWNRVEVVRTLLGLGADPNVPVEPGWAPLMYAASEGNVEIVGLLLQQGSDPNRRDAYGRSALDLAEEQGHVGVIELLRRAAQKLSQR